MNTKFFFILALLSAAAASVAAAEMPSIAGIKLGGTLGVDVPLCTPAEPKYMDCNGPAIDKVYCSKENERQRQSFSEVLTPSDGSLCLGTYHSFLARPPGQSWHWVVNPKRVLNLRVDDVRAYQGRVYFVAMYVSYPANETHQQALRRLTAELTAATGVRPRDIKSTDICSGAGTYLTCNVDFQREWETTDARYQLSLGLSHGTLEVRAKFNEPAPVQYDSLITQ